MMSPEESRTERLETSAPAKQPEITLIQQLINDVERLDKLLNESERLPLKTGRERQRLISAQVKNNGFIDSAFDVARDNPQFLPPHLKNDKLEKDYQKFDELRQLQHVAGRFANYASYAYMHQADLCYRESLAIYHSLHGQTMAKVHGAEALYKTMLHFFLRRKKTETEDKSGLSSDTEDMSKVL